MQLTTKSNSLPRDVIVPLPSELGAGDASLRTVGYRLLGAICARSLARSTRTGCNYVCPALCLPAGMRPVGRAALASAHGMSHAWWVVQLLRGVPGGSDARYPAPLRRPCESPSPRRRQPLRQQPRALAGPNLYGSGPVILGGLAPPAAIQICCKFGGWTQTPCIILSLSSETPTAGSVEAK